MNLTLINLEFTVPSAPYSLSNLYTDATVRFANTLERTLRRIPDPDRYRIGLGSRSK